MSLIDFNWNIYLFYCLKTINMLGTGEKPELLLSNCGELFFRPSCIHTSVSRHFEIRNVGRSVMYFRWVIPNVDTKCLSVEPCEGQILPNETQVSVRSLRLLDCDWMCNNHWRSQTIFCWRKIFVTRENHVKYRFEMQN